VPFSSKVRDLSTRPDLNAWPKIYLSRWRTGEILRVGPGDCPLNGRSHVGIPRWDATLVEFASSRHNPWLSGIEDLDDAAGTISVAAPPAANAQSTDTPVRHADLSSGMRGGTHADRNVLRYGSDERRSASAWPSK
jgi:hypothetical protein